MDKNSAIGLTLIAALLLAYFYWFAPTPEPQQEQPLTTSETVAPTLEDSVAETVPLIQDSVLTATYGDISAFMKGEESSSTLETEDLRIVFSNHGTIKELELKKYKTYYQEPLILIEPSTSKFKMAASYKGQDLDLYNLYYERHEQKAGDSTILSFDLKLADGSSLSHRYIIPSKGYEIKYSLDNKGFDKSLSSDITFSWNQLIKLTEKDLKQTRNSTTITYYTDDFDELSETSTDTEKETFSTAPQWVTIKQKYFLSSMISSTAFKGGDIEISTNESDTSLVKKANINLVLAKNDLAEGKINIRYYLGPNDYQLIGDVADKFAKNVYLGWPPVYWINKFVIFPVFHFLTLHIGNFGLIIIVLVILLKLVLAPLSYRSYLSMAKMKVLKPDLDEIKEKFPDDAQTQQKEQLKLYQQVGVNPISGCVPVLLQMPILFAMFYLFPASIELRQQSLLWASDLSTYDSPITFAALPLIGIDHISLFTLLMTVSTLIYTWQNNQLSSVQGPMKSMSYFMPLIFFFVLNSFSAGLTFYYFVSNLVTFAQQAIIKRFVNEDKIKTILEENRKKNIAGGGKKSKFMAKLEEAMKTSEETRKASEENRKKRKGK
jgi:YidC/Oxa1 family membrane protein insertase